MDAPNNVGYVTGTAAATSNGASNIQTDFVILM